MQVVISLWDVLVDGCAPELLWEFECRIGFCTNHGYACGKRWLLTTCQEVKCIFENIYEVSKFRLGWNS